MTKLIAGSESIVDVATSSPSPSISNIVFTVDAFSLDLGILSGV